MHTEVKQRSSTVGRPVCQRRLLQPGAQAKPGKVKAKSQQTTQKSYEIMPGPSFVFTCFSVHVTIQDPTKTVVGLRVLGRSATSVDMVRAHQKELCSKPLRVASAMPVVASKVQA